MEVRVCHKRYLPISFLDFILCCIGFDAEEVVQLGFFDHGNDPYCVEIIKEYALI